MDPDAIAAQELGAFLRSRRERIRPEDLGFAPGPRRRVTGLRREEVAALAGLSADYYQRLEQGRSTRPSDAVLDSLGDAFELDEVERAHVAWLARGARRRARRVERRPDHVPRNTRLLLAALRLPAYVVSRHLDVLAWNPLAAELLGDPNDLAPDERNVLLTLFRGDAPLPPGACEAMAMDFIGLLRRGVARDPGHPRGLEVVRALSARSAEFRALWARYDVRDLVRGATTVRHPRLGAIEVEWDAYPVPGSDGAAMVVLTPRPGHHDRLRLLEPAGAPVPDGSH